MRLMKLWCTSTSSSSSGHAPVKLWAINTATASTTWACRMILRLSLSLNRVYLNLTSTLCRPASSAALQYSRQKPVGSLRLMTPSRSLWRVCSTFMTLSRFKRNFSSRLEIARVLGVTGGVERKTGWQTDDSMAWSFRSFRRSDSDLVRWRETTGGRRRERAELLRWCKDAKACIY